jgi:hypothetical protein
MRFLSFWRIDCPERSSRDERQREVPGFFEESPGALLLRREDKTGGGRSLSPIYARETVAIEFQKRAKRRKKQCAIALLLGTAGKEKTGSWCLETSSTVLYEYSFLIQK